MSNYIVITYDEKDNNNKNPLHIENLHYCSKEEVMRYVLELQKQANIKYEIYKEVFLEIQEEIS